MTRGTRTLRKPKARSVALSSRKKTYRAALRSRDALAQRAHKLVNRIQAQVALAYGWPEFETNAEREAIVFRDAWRLIAGGLADPFLAEFASKWPKRFTRLQPLIEQHRALGKLLLAADADLISILKGVSDTDLQALEDESDAD